MHTPHHLRRHKHHDRLHSNSKFFAFVALAFALILLVAFLRITDFGKPTGRYLDLAKCGNEIVEPDYGEECEIGNETACPGKCKYDCTCAYCGNDVVDEHEDCDGASDFSCPEQCQVNCKCPPAESRALTSKYRQTVFYDVVLANMTYPLDIIKKSEVPLQNLTFFAYADMQDIKIYIDSNITALPGYALIPADYVYYYFNITSKNPAKLRADSTFRVERKWYSNNKLDNKTTVLRRWDGRWLNLNTLRVSEDDKYFYYWATSPGIGLFAVTADKIPPSKVIMPVCGNGVNETGETEQTCCADVTCSLANETCINNACTFTARCGNKICEQTEDAKNCAVDCGVLVLFLPQFMFVFVILMLLSAFSIFHLVNKNREKKLKVKKPKKERAMVSLSAEDEQVSEYIKEHLKKGFSDNAIRNSLVHAGWEPDFIDEMIQENKSKVD